MHWKRHSFISGPVNHRDGGLHFDATIKTFFCEDDLRRNVFAKAFAALRDLNSQLEEETITVKIPKPTIQWDRGELWKLLLIGQAGRESCESVDRLKEQVQKSFETDQEKCFDLTDLCLEIGNDSESICSRIQHIADQLLQQGILIGGTGAETIAVDTSKSSTTFMGETLRTADELDVLFKGEFAGNHEFELHCSEFGKRLVANQVVPLIKKHYGFDPCQNPNDQSLVDVLKASPSAARFALELKPIPSDLVKRRLLATVVVAGFSRDCLQNPQLILDKTVRDAFRKVVEIFTTNYDKTIEFYEELALVGGFDSQKLSEIIQHSDEWNAEASKHVSQEWTDAKVSVSQKVAAGQPEQTTLFPYFMLAGIRSGNHVELRCNYGSSITLDTTGLPLSAGSNHEPRTIPPCSFAVGPR